jgi:hypothetical protein
MALSGLLFGLGFAAVATLSGGWAVGRIAGAQALTPLERDLAGFLIGAFAISFSVWAIGSINFTPASMWALAAAWSAAALAAAKSWFGRPRTFEGHRLAWLALAGIVVLTLLAGLAPPADYDGLNYHLLLPRRDLELGRITALANDRVFDAFPALAEMLYRLALATAGAPAAQVVHGLFAIAAAFGALALVRRLGGGATASIVAGALFLAIRIVVWEAGTTHNELALAAYFSLALLAYLAWRDEGGIGAMIVAGLAIGAACNVKYHGLVLAAAFLPLMAHDVIRLGRRVAEPVAGVGIAALAFVPLMARNWVSFGNPLAPMLANWFPGSDPSARIDFRPPETALVDSLIGFVRSPWDIFIHGNVHYDGHVFGAPYLLLLVPLALAGWRKLGHRWAVAAVFGLYYVAWYFMMFHTTRFLIPMFPVLAALAGIGALVLWDAARGVPAARWATLALFGLLALNQSMFVGAYAALRLAATAGVIGEAAYLVKAPGQSTTFFAACRFVEKTLRPGQRYLALTTMRSYYCPQAPAVHDLFDDERRRWARRPRPFPALSAGELAERMTKAPIALVFVATATKYATGSTAEWSNVPLDLSRQRFWPTLVPALDDLAPVFESASAKVYDGAAVAERLRKRASQ